MSIESVARRSSKNLQEQYSLSIAAAINMSRSILNNLIVTLSILLGWRWSWVMPNRPQFPGSISSASDLLKFASCVRRW